MTCGRPFARCNAASILQFTLSSLPVLGNRGDASRLSHPTIRISPSRSESPFPKRRRARWKGERGLLNRESAFWNPERSFLKVKSSFLKGESGFLKGESPFWNRGRPFWNGESAFRNGESEFWKRESALLKPESAFLKRKCALLNRDRSGLTAGPGVWTPNAASCRTGRVGLPGLRSFLAPVPPLTPRPLPVRWERGW